MWKESKMWFLSLLWFLVVYSGLNNSFCERLPILVWDDAGLYHWFYYHQTHWRCSPPIPILLLLERQRCIYMKYWFLVWILLVGPRYAVSESQVTSSRFPLSSNSFSIICQQNTRYMNTFYKDAWNMPEFGMHCFLIYANCSERIHFTCLGFSYSNYERKEWN